MESIPMLLGLEEFQAGVEYLFIMVTGSGIQKDVCW